jgi:hypothetical protein
MSNDELRRRIEALERRLKAEQPGETCVIHFTIMFGGLPTPHGEPIFANAGEHQWLRSAEESLDQFADRVRTDIGKLELLPGHFPVLIGGLPHTQEQQDLALAAYDEWLKTDDGVPPCEP